MNPETLLLRQVNPLFVNNGRITSQVFKPTKKDHGLVSVYHGDMITPADSHAHFVAQPECRSLGVVAVTVVEVTTEQLAARLDPRPFPQHAVIDFTSLEGNAVERASKKLRVSADVRGWLHPPANA